MKFAAHFAAPASVSLFIRDFVRGHFLVGFIRRSYVPVVVAHPYAPNGVVGSDVKKHTRLVTGPMGVRDSVRMFT